MEIHNKLVLGFAKRASSYKDIQGEQFAELERSAGSVKPEGGSRSDGRRRRRAGIP